MSDFDQNGEELDENLPADYPPDEPLGVYDEEATGVEAPDDDLDDGAPVDDLEPEVWEQEGDAGRGVVVAGDSDVDAGDDVEKDLVASPGVSEDLGALDADDDFSGDETTRDYATEHVPVPAEEAAVRVEAEPPGAVG
jgi:hypothetical protein